MNPVSIMRRSLPTSREYCHFPGSSLLLTPTYSLSDMTGTFNATVQAEINGSSIPVSAASTTPTAGASSTPVSVLASNANVSPNSASSTSAVVAGSSTPQSASSNGAGRIVVPGVLGATGVAAFAFAFFL